MGMKDSPMGRRVDENVFAENCPAQTIVVYLRAKTKLLATR